MIKKISIVVCVYNEELCLIHALRSIKHNNMYRDIEIIIVNDCSENPITKRMLALLERFADFKLVHSPINLGLSNSRNLGFQNATADYIAPLDADDTFPRGAIDKIYNAFIKNPDIDFVYGDYKLVDLNKNQAQLIKCDVITKNNRIDLFAIFNNWIMMGQSPCKKVIWEEIGGYAQKYANTVQDVDFWTRALQKKAVGLYVPENIYCWNRCDSGMNETFDRTDYYLLLEEHYSFLKKYKNKKQLVNTISEGFYKHKKLRKMIVFNIKHLFLVNYKNCLRPIILFKNNLIMQTT